MRRTLALGALISMCALGAGAAPAVASRGQTAMVEDQALLTDAPASVHAMRLLGVSQTRLVLPWNRIAPSPKSSRVPRHFTATDPAAYPKGVWIAWDDAVIAAAKGGITVDMDVMGGEPRWAAGPGLPTGQPHPSWAPNASQYGAFVRAAAVRYSGKFDPVTNKLDPGNPDDLPAVHMWSIWNEPDYGPSLSPQGLPGNLGVEHSPSLYRSLLDQGWNALQHTGHGRDTILFGELAPRGYPARGVSPHYSWGVFSGMKPLTFLRALYCVDANYRPLRGRAASLRGCPSTSAGSRAFARQHPALFKAGGVSDHPYSRWYPPNTEQVPDPDYSVLAQIGQLEHSLDRLQRVYGSHRRYPIYNTEYGYITSPPQRSDRRRKIYYVSTATAAAFLNQAEYISWRDPRIASFNQFLLRDPLPANKQTNNGGFASGLITYAGKQKVTYSAWRLPLFLPRTSFRKGSRLEVWGCARPAFFGLTETYGPEQVQIQWARPRSSAFRTIRTVTITDPHGYFDIPVGFPGTGAVRLVYRYPVGDPGLPANYPVYSRHVAIAQVVPGAKSRH